MERNAPASRLARAEVPHFEYDRGGHRRRARGAYQHRRSARTAFLPRSPRCSRRGSTRSAARPHRASSFFPCELIEANGATLRRIVLEHARRWGFDRACRRMDRRRCRFFDTLVDRIVPGFPERGGRDALFAEWGYRGSARDRRRAVPSLGDRGAGRHRRGAAARQGRRQHRLDGRHPALSRAESAASQRNSHRKRARRLSRRSRHGRRDNRRSAVRARAEPARV